MTLSQTLVVLSVARFKFDVLRALRRLHFRVLVRCEWWIFRTRRGNEPLAVHMRADWVSFDFLLPRRSRHNSSDQMSAPEALNPCQESGSEELERLVHRPLFLHPLIPRPPRRRQ